MDAKGAKDTPVGIFSQAAGALYNASGRVGPRSSPRGVPKVLQGSLWLKLWRWEQSFAALASFASMAVCSCR